MTKFQKIYNGKVCELYKQKSNFYSPIVKVYTDRVSSFEQIQGEIPGLGILRKKLTDFFKNQIVKNFQLFPLKHDLIEDKDFIKYVLNDFSRELHEQTSVVYPLSMDNFEHIFRIYGAGSAIDEFNEGFEEKCGNVFPQNFCENYKFDEIWYTPTVKDKSKGFVQDITQKEMADILISQGVSDTVAQLIVERNRNITLECAKILENVLKKAGFVLIDGKIEFGTIFLNNSKNILNLNSFDNSIALGDEISTDTLRITPIDGFKIGKKAESFDRQIIKDYVKDYQKSHPGEPVILSPEIKKAYRDKSEKLYTALTGEKIYLPEIN